MNQFPISLPTFTPYTLLHIVVIVHKTCTAQIEVRKICERRSRFILLRSYLKALALRFFNGSFYMETDQHPKMLFSTLTHKINGFNAIFSSSSYYQNAILFLIIKKLISLPCIIQEICSSDIPRKTVCFQFSVKRVFY